MFSTIYINPARTARKYYKSWASLIHSPKFSSFTVTPRPKFAFPELSNNMNFMEKYKIKKKKNPF